MSEQSESNGPQTKTLLTPSNRMERAPRKAVIFDLDGVLLDSMTYHVRAWLRAFEHEGIAPPPDEFLQREGESSQATVKAILRKYDVRVTTKKIDRIGARKEMIFREIFQIKWYPSATRLIDLLHRQRWRLALVSGSPLDFCRRMNQSLGEAFDTLIADGATERGKPFADPYLAALDAIRLRAQECLAIENSPFGIRSARRAGLRCWAVRSTRPTGELREADRLFPDLAALYDVFLHHGRRLEDDRSSREEA